MHPLDNRHTPSQSSAFLGMVACAISAAAVVVFLGWLLSSGAGYCPADTGTVPARLMDGRTVCVIPSNVEPR